MELPSALLIPSLKSKKIHSEKMSYFLKKSVSYISKIHSKQVLMYSYILGIGTFWL